MTLWLNLLLIGCAGALGALTRFGVSIGMRSLFGSHFPVGTMVVNLAGCFILGVLTGFLDAKLLDEKLTKDVREIIGVGFLGALTTFSTFGVETVTKVQQGHMLVATANIGVNLVFGLAFAATGIWLAKWLSG